MGYQVRSFRLPDETNAAIREVRKNGSFRSDTEALIHIVSEYVKGLGRTLTKNDLDAVTGAVAEQIRREYKDQIRKIMYSTGETERRSHLILDAVNTMLYDSSATFLMEASGQLRHEVIRQSEENYTKMLEHRKQIRDEKRWKKGVMEGGRDPDPGPGG